MKRKRILIAVQHDALPSVSRALSGYELIVITTLHQAQRMVVEDGIDLFVVEIHFDDSQAIPLIKFIRADRHHKLTPILVVRLQPSENATLLKATYQVMRAIHANCNYEELETERDVDLHLVEAVEACLKSAKSD